MQTQRRHAEGFTLIELAVVLCILGVLSAIAAPAFTQLIATQRVKSAASDLLTALTRARSEAIKRNTDVTLAPNTGGWVAGWSIANPSNTARKIDDHGPVRAATIVGPTNVAFHSNGRVRGNADVSFDISSSSTQRRLCVGLDLSGHASIRNGGC